MTNVARFLDASIDLALRSAQTLVLHYSFAPVVLRANIEVPENRTTCCRAIPYFQLSLAVCGMASDPSNNCSQRFRIFSVAVNLQ